MRTRVLARLSCLAVFVGLCAFSASAQKLWEKPMDKWGGDDAMKIITNSPFAQQYQDPKSAASADAQRVAGEQAQSAIRGGSNPRSVARQQAATPITIRLHSAVPVRQAIVRLRQLSAGYDKLSAEDKKKFDDQQKGFLECKICTDYYVVTIDKFRDSSTSGIDEGLFQRTKFEEIKGNVWLMTDKGTKIDLFQFTPPRGPGDFATFFFKRKNDAGQPNLTPDMKNFKFVFNNEFLNTDNPYAYAGARGLRRVLAPAPR